MPSFELIYSILSSALLFIIAIVLHEVAHGYVAYLLGDPTAKNAGRLTLNPIMHLDLLGTLALFILKFGWAKPVPIDPMYFKNPRRGIFLVSLAGPAMNFLLASIFSACAFFLIRNELVLEFPRLFDFCKLGVFINCIFIVFNLLPIPPLDGSKLIAVFLPGKIAFKYLSFDKYGLIILFGIFWVTGYVGIPLRQHLILPPLNFLVSFFGFSLG